MSEADVMDILERLKLLNSKKLGEYGKWDVGIAIDIGDAITEIERLRDRDRLLGELIRAIKEAMDSDTTLGRILRAGRDLSDGRTSARRHL